MDQATGAAAIATGSHPAYPSGKARVNDTATAVIGIGGMAFLGCAVGSWVASKIVALRARPNRRAIWTAGLPAVLTLLGSFGLPAEAAVPFALATVSFGLLTFLFWRREFQAAWLDDGQMPPEGMAFENSDWKVGLGALASALAAGAAHHFIVHAVTWP